MIAMRPHTAGAILVVRAQPGSKRNTILGERAGALGVGVTAAPEKGKANMAIRAILAEVLDCRASQITLVSGETSRQKQFLIAGITPAELERRLATLVFQPKSSPERA
jgi:uncharacterized protein (TIGR00251 family)